ncbi:hypothetical protein ACWD5R_39525 [Streptomyces sp. NPDC002514]|uniref:hypothetical protein n=1 Tax=Streptomyces sp. NPDC001270 TaxID=3364554 RepID=UPI0036CB5806
MCSAGVTSARRPKTPHTGVEVLHSIEQIGLLLTGAARAIANDVRQRAGTLPETDGRRLFAETVLAETATLAKPSRDLEGVQSKARLLRALYGRLDRLQHALPTTEAAPTNR